MYPEQVNAVQVGSYFVGQYYIILQSQPDQAFQFYGSSSTMKRMDGDSIDTAAGQMQIHSLVSNLNFTSIEIKTAHSLDSWNGGVLVMVTGFVQIQDYVGRRKFAQTFFLAPQEKGFFVLNDIFQFLEEESVPEPSAPGLPYSNYESNLNASNHIQEPVSGYIHEEETQTEDYTASAPVLAEEHQARSYVAPAVHATESETFDDYSVPEHQQHVPETDGWGDEVPAEEPVASLPNTMNTVNLPSAPSEEPAGERPKLSYASILRLAKEQRENSMPPAAPVRKATPVASDAPVAIPQPTYQSLPTRHEKSGSDAATDFGNMTLEDDGYGESKSVYVGNLPPTVSASDLENEFKNFGRIIPDGVSVRSRKDSGGFYAFVEFEDAISVQNALQGSPIVINGRQIYCEERRPNSGIFRGRGRGRGRGGYQPESTRGRFGGRSYGGRGGNERGILGNHASRNGQY